MSRILCSWVGETDWRYLLRQSKEPGPILRTLKDPDWGGVDEVHLLNNYHDKHDDRKGSEYKKFLAKKTKAKVFCKDVTLSSPTNFEEVERAASELLKTLPDSAELILLCSPGTWVMSVALVLQKHNAYQRARLIEASKEADVVEIKIPFNIYVRDIIERADAARREASTDRRPFVAEFENIKHDCQPMRDAIERANQLAPRGLSVLIEGESGSGRSTLAQCMHRKSNRGVNNFHSINCSAYSIEQLETELFGHSEKSRAHGIFRKNKDSTLYIEEVDALPSHLQTRLLQAIADPITVRRNFRLIFSSIRSLREAVSDGSFRSDLFYRIAEDIIWLPPLRDRGAKDLELITDELLRQLKKDLKDESGDIAKKLLDPGARTALNGFPFKGNVRELSSVLVRAMVYSKQPIISKDDIEEALGVTRVGTITDDIMNRPLDEDFVLDEVLDEVTRHYVARAKRNTKSLRQAAKVLGFKNYQTLANRIKNLKDFEW